MAAPRSGFYRESSTRAAILRLDLDAGVVLDDRGDTLEKLDPLPLVVKPTMARRLVGEVPGASVRGEPDLTRGALRIYDALLAIPKRERDDVPGAFDIDVVGIDILEHRLDMTKRDIRELLVSGLVHGLLFAQLSEYGKVNENGAIVASNALPSGRYI